jgi:hypothetical protein
VANSHWGTVIIAVKTHWLPSIALEMSCSQARTCSALSQRMFVGSDHLSAVLVKFLGLLGTWGTAAALATSAEPRPRVKTSRSHAQELKKHTVPSASARSVQAASVHDS